MISKLKEIREYLVEEILKVPELEDVQIFTKGNTLCLALPDEEWYPKNIELLKPILALHKIVFAETNDPSQILIPTQDLTLRNICIQKLISDRSELVDYRRAIENIVFCGAVSGGRQKALNDLLSKYKSRSTDTEKRNYAAVNIKNDPQLTYFFNQLTEGEMIDAIMGLCDGNLANYKIYEQLF
jgi:hypothetical protein